MTLVAIVEHLRGLYRGVRATAGRKLGGGEANEDSRRRRNRQPPSLKFRHFRGSGWEWDCQLTLSGDEALGLFLKLRPYLRSIPHFGWGANGKGLEAGLGRYLKWSQQPVEPQKHRDHDPVRFPNFREFCYAYNIEVKEP